MPSINVYVTDAFKAQVEAGTAEGRVWAENTASYEDLFCISRAFYGYDLDGSAAAISAVEDAMKALEYDGERNQREIAEELFDGDEHSSTDAFLLAFLKAATEIFVENELQPARR